MPSQTLPPTRDDDDERPRVGPYTTFPQSPQPAGAYHHHPPPHGPVYVGVPNSDYPPVIFLSEGVSIPKAPPSPTYP